jgi:hypothetical protein
MIAPRKLAPVVFLFAINCAPRARGSDRELPPRPTIGAPIDRAGRPLTANMLIGLLEQEEYGECRKEEYNRAAEADRAGFIPDLEHGLAIYDSFDGVCGNQWLADPATPPAQRYHRLATALADDRLWIDSRSPRCTRFLAVEMAALPGSGGTPDDTADCGGRTPGYDTVDAMRSLFVLGKLTGIDDGIPRDDREHSATAFPFLAAP